jgi:hypothetical protein
MLLGLVAPLFLSDETGNFKATLLLDSMLTPITDNIFCALLISLISGFNNNDQLFEKVQTSALSLVPKEP